MTPSEIHVPWLKNQSKYTDSTIHSRYLLTVHKRIANKSDSFLEKPNSEEVTRFVL